MMNHIPKFGSFIMEEDARKIMGILQKKRVEFLRDIANVISLEPDDIVDILGQLKLTISMEQGTDGPDTTVEKKRKPGRPKKTAQPRQLCQGVVKDSKKNSNEPCKNHARPGSLYCGKHRKQEAETSKAVSLPHKNSQSRIIYEVVSEELFLPYRDFIPLTTRFLKMAVFQGSYYYLDRASGSLYQYVDDECEYIGYLKNGDIQRQFKKSP